MSDIKDLPKPTGKFIRYAYPPIGEAMILTSDGWWVTDESYSFWRGPYRVFSLAESQYELFVAACVNQEFEEL